MNEIAYEIAALEWRCPGRLARQAWKKLTPAEQERIDGAIKQTIHDYQNENS